MSEPSTSHLYIGHVPDAADRRARTAAIYDAALQVFGDDAPFGMWVYQPCPALGVDGWGASYSPYRLAAEGEEGLARARAELERIAPGVTPRWRPKIEWRGKLNRKRRR